MLTGLNNEESECIFVSSSPWSHFFWNCHNTLERQREGWLPARNILPQWHQAESGRLPKQRKGCSVSRPELEPSAPHSLRRVATATPFLWDWVSFPEEWRSWSMWAIRSLMVLNIWDSLTTNSRKIYFLGDWLAFMVLWKSQQGWTLYTHGISLSRSLGISWELKMHFATPIGLKKIYLLCDVRGGN